MTYSYLNVVWKVEADCNVIKEINKLLSDYYVEYSEECAPDFKVSIKEEKYKNLNDVLQYGEKITIHNSKKPEVHEEGLKYDNGMTRTVFNKTTKSIYLINYLTNCIIIYNTNRESLYKDGVRVIRDMVKFHVENKNCSALFHAATVEKNGKGILLVGTKGSGKTTISLKLIFEHGFNEVSRDRTFIYNNNGNIKLWGWPNYYNLTLRTMKTFKQTENLIPEKFKNFNCEELQKVSKKIQLLPHDIGINKTIRTVSLDNLVILVNKNQNSNTDIMEAFAENWYTPNDLNYPVWMGLFSNPNIINNNNNILLNLLKTYKIEVVEWSEIDDAVQKIRELV